jgi:hypothetical protein
VDLYIHYHIRLHSVVKHRDNFTLLATGTLVWGSDFAVADELIGIYSCLDTLKMIHITGDSLRPFNTSVDNSQLMSRLGKTHTWLLLE